MRLQNITTQDVNTTYDNELTLLAGACLDAKHTADLAREVQLEAERQFLASPIVQASLKEVGTTNFLEGFVKVATKLNQKWDQKQLADIIKSNDWPIMPFDIEYKPNAARLKVLQEQFPDSYRKLQTALTVTPAKPYFTFSE